jgi:GTP diphosphokinase / guanosine-3',5'-bis(diphosphate) 3'-diphosphatase
MEDRLRNLLPLCPIGYRLGLYAIKSELEDLALKYTEPSVYESVHNELEESREIRKKLVDSFLAPVQDSLNHMGVNAQIVVAEKSASSIWSRMREKEIPFSDVYDTFVVRFIVDCQQEVEKLSVGVFMLP